MPACPQSARCLQSRPATTSPNRPQPQESSSATAPVHLSEPRHLVGDFALRFPSCTHRSDDSTPSPPLSPSPAASPRPAIADRVCRTNPSPENAAPADAAPRAPGSSAASAAAPASPATAPAAVVPASPDPLSTIPATNRSATTAPASESPPDRSSTWPKRSPSPVADAPTPTASLPAPPPRETPGQNPHASTATCTACPRNCRKYRRNAKRSLFTAPD